MHSIRFSTPLPQILPLNRQRLKRAAFSGLLLTAALFSTHAARAQTAYTITDLGLLSGGTYSSGTGVNNSGQVAGFGDATDGQQHAFLYTPGVGIQNLGTLPGGTFSFGTGINDAGQATGYADTSNYSIHPFIYNSSTGMVDVGALGYDDGMFGNTGNGINNSGQVTGQVYVSEGLIHAFLYSSGTGYKDLGTLGGNVNLFGSIGYAINDAGQVTGNADTPTGASHAFLSSASTGMKDLGTLPGGTTSVGYAINSAGQVAGTADAANGESYAFFYSRGTGMKNLGTLPQARDSDGNGVNSSGTVVGDATLSNIYDHAFVYTQRAGMQDLNDLIPANSGWQLMSAHAISDTGYITGYGQYQGNDHAFLLTPTAAAQPAVLHLDPASRTVGRDGFTLTVIGIGFTAGSVILWNGAAQTTTFVDAAHLTAPIPASLIAAAGTVPVTVSTPGFGTSNGHVETIHPRPVLSSLSPSRKTAGGPTFQLTVMGTGFLRSSLIKWNGVALPTTYAGANQIYAHIPASYIAHAGTAGVTVTTPDVATSAHSKTFLIVAP